VNDMTNQTTHAEAQAKTDSDAEAEARCGVKPVKVRTQLTRTCLQHARIYLVQIRTRVGDSRDYLSCHLHWMCQILGEGSSIADVTLRSCGTMADVQYDVVVLVYVDV
jgi:hypothetical protein